MTADNDAISKCHNAAIRLLAIREHSQFELRQKLSFKNYDGTIVDQVMDDLQIHNLQSDERYSGSVMRARLNKGYGPLYIQNYLLNKGVNQQIIDSALDFNDLAWQKALLKAALKKFGSAPPADFKEKAKQMNFLLRRGFSSEQIRNYYTRQNDDVGEYEDQ